MLSQQNRKELYNLSLREIEKVKTDLRYKLSEELAKKEKQEKEKMLKNATKEKAFVKQLNDLNKKSREIETTIEVLKEKIRKDDVFSLDTNYDDNDFKTYSLLVYSTPKLDKGKDEMCQKLDKVDDLKIKVFAKIYEMESDFSSVIDFIRKEVNKL